MIKHFRNIRKKLHYKVETLIIPPYQLVNKKEDGIWKTYCGVVLQPLKTVQNEK